MFDKYAGGKVYLPKVSAQDLQKRCPGKIAV
jgi:hypothetical protein